MIARHWRGIVKREEAARYVKHLRMDTVPQLSRIKGFINASILQREVDAGIEFLVITRWSSMEAIRQFAGEAAHKAVVPPVVQAMMIEYDQEAKHYEVVEDTAENGV